MVAPRSRWVIPAAALLGVTAIWGWTFLVVRDAVSAYPVTDFLALRFAIATCCLLVAVAWRGGNWRHGAIPGIVLALAYLTQTLGLQHTTASRAGLLTGLFVVFTPLFELALYRRLPSRSTMGAVAIAVAGSVLLAMQGGLHGGPDHYLGDGLEVVTALLLSGHLLLLGTYSRHQTATGMALGQMATGCVFFSLIAAPTGLPPVPSARVWVALVITGVLASALAFLVQSYVQQRLSPSRTAVILVTEPAFALAFGVLLAGDPFSRLQAVGAALILIALILQEGAALTSVRENQSAVT